VSPGRHNQGARLVAAVRREPGITYAGLAQSLRVTVKRVGEIVRLYQVVGLLEVQLTRGVPCVRPAGVVVPARGSDGG